MTPLERHLLLIPSVYAELATAAVPGQAAEPPDHSPDPRNKPTPARLDVVEHRHLLVRGLRWWVDAVGAEDAPRRIGESVADVEHVVATMKLPSGWRWGELRYPTADGQVAESHRDLCPTCVTAIRNLMMGKGGG